MKRLNKYLLNRMEKTPLEAVSRLYKAFSHWEPMLLQNGRESLNNAGGLESRAKGVKTKGQDVLGPQSEHVIWQ